MLTAFHTTKRNPESKALNAVLESVWVMPPSILHHNEVPEKGDKAETHPSAFRAGTLCQLWAASWRGRMCPQPWQGKAGTFPCWDSHAQLPFQLLSQPCPSHLLSCVSPSGPILFPSLDRSFWTFEILSAVLGAALKSTKPPTAL